MIRALDELYENNLINGFGFSSIFLLLLYPVVWIQKLSTLCYICCCAPQNHLSNSFFQYNHYYLIIALISFMILFPIDLLFTNQVDNDKNRLLMTIEIIKPFSALLLILSALSTIEYTLIYLFLGLCVGNIIFRYKKVFNIYIAVIILLFNPISGQLYEDLFYAFACSCDKKSSVKANMHKIQTVLEEYKIEKKEYPKNLLEIDNKLKDYFYNPYTNENGYKKSYIDFDVLARRYFNKTSINNTTNEELLDLIHNSKLYIEVLGIRIFNKNAPQPKGLVVYLPISKNNYKIFGISSRIYGTFVLDKGKIFYLENN